MADVITRRICMRLTHVFSIAALASALTATAVAQGAPEVKLPASPMGQAAIQVGGTWQKTDTGGQQYRDGKWIVVDYSRPLLRGRKDIFGSGDQYGKAVTAGAPVWRAGANATTRLTTQVPLTIGGKTIDPGVYSVFVDLKPGNWTLVLSSQPVQEKYDPNDKERLFGAYNYDPKYDVLRVPMSVQQSDTSLEQFTVAFTNVSDTSATMVMYWDRTVATADLRIGTAGTR
jgi:hypothetical protein